MFMLQQLLDLPSFGSNTLSLRPPLFRYWKTYEQTSLVHFVSGQENHSIELAITPSPSQVQLFNIISEIRRVDQMTALINDAMS